MVFPVTPPSILPSAFPPPGPAALAKARLSFKSATEVPQRKTDIEPYWMITVTMVYDTMMLQYVI